MSQMRGLRLRLNKIFVRVHTLPQNKAETQSSLSYVRPPPSITAFVPNKNLRTCLGPAQGTRPHSQESFLTPPGTAGPSSSLPPVRTIQAP